jgi:rhamnulokinase
MGAMTATKNLLAFDLGAESGRGVLGRFDGQRLRLEVVHRFANGAVRTLDTLHWDVLRLYSEMLAALRRSAADLGGIDCLGVDTWGVDFALLGRGGTLLGNPRHYRDPHTEGIMEAVLARVPRQEIFRQTGLQFMRFNTLFQLAAMQRDRSPLLDVAESLLFIPDLFNYMFTGIKVNEFTDASTSQMLDPSTQTWAYGLLQALGLPAHLPGSLVAPGTVLGPLRSAVAVETGVQPVPVIATASHDTAAAVAAVPADGSAWAYISSGTWSLMGVELAGPLINEPAQRYNFTNEGGAGGTIRFLKNIMGLWLVQECRRAWDREGRSFSYEELVRLAEAAPACHSLVDPDAVSFILPPSMPAALADFCRKTGQPAPEDPGAVIRCALDSLALRYRWVMERLEELTGRRLDLIHIVGGGSQNTLLCQLTADACNRNVLAGPVEATAIGNVLVQLLGLGLFRSLAEAREVVRRSFELRSYAPQQPDRWQEPYERFQLYLDQQIS